MNQRELILASSSPFRRELLERLKLPFQCVSPNVNEDTAQAEQQQPDTLATVLARQKAIAVAAVHTHAAVIGSDQVCAVDGEILNKPGTVEKARQQLRRLSGRSHVLHSAVCLVTDGELEEFSVRTRLTMREMSDSEIERYVAADAPEQCAGSYRIESLGITLFESIQTEDFTAIVGLPLMRLSALLRNRGWNLP